MRRRDLLLAHAVTLIAAGSWAISCGGDTAADKAPPRTVAADAPSGTVDGTSHDGNPDHTDETSDAHREAISADALREAASIDAATESLPDATPDSADAMLEGSTCESYDGSCGIPVVPGAPYDLCADYATTLAAACGEPRLLRWRGSCGSERRYLALSIAFATTTIFYDTATGKPVGWLHGAEFGEGMCRGDLSCPEPRVEPPEACEP